MSTAKRDGAGSPGPSGRSAGVWRPRSELVLLVQQVRAIDRFNRWRQARETALGAAFGRSREMDLDAAREMQVLRCQHDALIAQAHAHLLATGDVLHTTAPRRAVLAHRDERFMAQVALVLREAGVTVLAQVDNGAEAIGLLVAEQPDLLLAQDQLAMSRPGQVLREAREFAPGTLVGVQASHDDRTGPLLLGGAAAVFSRHTLARDVADELLRLLST
jgi:hypothetical protein